MSSIISATKQFIDRWFNPPKPLTPGMYASSEAPNAENPHRLHLRIEPGGSGLLIINAATVLHLNQTGTEIAYGLVQGQPSDEIARNLASRYQITTGDAFQDVENFLDRVETLIQTPDLDPVTFLDFEQTEPYSSATLPYRLDCALTYRLPDSIDPDLAPHTRAQIELGTQEWKAILADAWQAGVPHVIFTGGEPLLRTDLVEILQEAENLGMVSGMLTTGLPLLENGMLDQCLMAGLDHILLLLQPDIPASWQVIERCLAADLFTTVHLTVTPATMHMAESTLQRLLEMHPGAVSLSQTSPDSSDTLQALRIQVAEAGQRLVWELPVPFGASNPVNLELQIGDAAPDHHPALYVEPDGDVCPSQAEPDVLGNLTRQSLASLVK